MPTKPKPDETKALHGEKRPERMKGPNPTYSKRKPTAPRSMRDAARRYWDEYAPVLYEAGILEDVDRHALATLCELEVDEDEAYAILDKVGRYYSGPNGTWAMHPAAKELPRIHTQKRMYYGQFGLTPHAREGLHIEEPEEQDPAALRAAGILNGDF